MLTVCVVVDIRTKARIVRPAILPVVNATLTEPTPVPSTAFDCTMAIPPPPALAVTAILRAFVAVCPLLSLTCTVKLLVPELLGVPEIAPVEAPRVSPAGRVPETTTDQLYGVTPPLAASVALYATFCCPFGNDAVVIPTWF